MSEATLDTICIDLKTIIKGCTMTLGERIAKCLQAKGLNQRQLAEACGWESPGRISHYINNRRSPALSDINCIAKVLKCSPAWLAYGENTPPSYLSSDIPKGCIPILTWEELRIMLTENSPITDNKNLTYLEYKHSGTEIYYALKLRPNFQSDNFNGRIYFAENDYIIVNINAIPETGNYVLVYSSIHNELSFMHYLGSKMKPFLSLPNRKDSYVEMLDDIILHGVVAARITLLK